MNLLVSKIQHKEFEVGEFVEEKDRDYEETIALIESFPWEIERKNLNVNLTNPSVTIQGKHGDFLKLGLFYNGKFVLHYFKDETLFTKSFSSFQGTYSYIEKFFTANNFDITGFKKENTWMQKNRQHFISQSFRYVATPEVVKRYLISTSGFAFCFSLFMILLLIVKPLLYLNFNSDYYTAIVPFLAIIIFLLGGGMHLIIFFNFYNNVRDKVLIMSKGNSIFYYGDINDPQRYDKLNIVRFTTVQPTTSRNPLSVFAIVSIEFNNGKQIQIPNLLVDSLKMQEKLTGIPKIELNKIPFIKS
jgi:hypothetical protein